jgi:hypothetical protein
MEVILSQIAKCCILKAINNKYKAPGKTFDRYHMSDIKTVTFFNPNIFVDMQNGETLNVAIKDTFD